MSRQIQNAQQQILAEASQTYFESLPPFHRELISLIAADLRKTPRAVVAMAMEDMITKWRDQSVPASMRRRFA